MNTLCYVMLCIALFLLGGFVGMILSALLIVGTEGDNGDER